MQLMRLPRMGIVCGLLVASMLAACLGGGGSGNGGWKNISTSVNLTGVAVTPAALTISSGKTATLSATGIYTDGSTADITSQVTWNVAAPATATVDANGVVSGVAIGTTTVTASLNGYTSPATGITVTAATLSSIAITPAATSLAKGAHTTLTAIGTYSDGSSSDISTQVIWTSASPAIASVGANTGAVTGIAPGATTINATMDGITSPAVNITVTAAVLNSITITSAATLAKGTSANLAATGTYTDGTTADMTTQVTWVSAAPSIAAVGSHTGSVIGTAVGSTTVNAVLDGITSNNANINVTAATLDSIAITPASVSFAKGTNTNLSAIGTYSDGSTVNLTTQVTWLSAAPATVGIGVNTGIALASAVGTTSITASLGGIIAPAVSITVTPAVLTGIALTPASASLAKGTSTSLTATGTYSDGSTADITTQATWASAATGTAAVGANTGIVVGAAVGSTTVSAAMDGITSPAASITVTPAILTGIAITPASATIAKGSTQTFTATGTYSDATTGNISGTATWNIANTAVASINTSGIATGLSLNTTTITASLSGITSNTATLNVINTAPVANAGAVQSVLPGTPVTLNGSASADANGDPLTYSWTLTGSPAGSTATLTGATTVAPAFTADLPGVYTVTLTVNDGLVNSASSTVYIAAITPHFNDTGISQCYQAGSTVLVACNSAGAIALNSAQDGMAGRDADAAANNGADGNLGFSFAAVAGGCVQDNVTGLMWEVKTTDGGLRDWNKTYTNYDSTTALQKLVGGAPTQAEIDAATNTVGYVAAVNASALCGFTDWRLPTAEELQSIVDVGAPAPMIDATWFPNTKGNMYWSSSPNVYVDSNAWYVHFGNGSVSPYDIRTNTYSVRLVRAGL